MGKYNVEKVLDVHHWTEDLFSFRTTRDPSFRFKNGHFTMIGLQLEDGKPLMRAYSMASANHEDTLEFFSIKVQDGPLTSRLQHLEIDDEILVGQKPTGTLISGNLLPGRNLYLVGTGTGLAPFLSIVKDPEIYEQFQNVILVHGVRYVDELAYHEVLTSELPQNEYLGDMIRDQLTYYPTVTREDFRNQGRVTELIDSGELTRNLGMPELSLEEDRFMVCGSPGLLKDMVTILTERGFQEAKQGHQGHFVIERAFVEQ